MCVCDEGLRINNSSSCQDLGAGPCRAIVQAFLFSLPCVCVYTPLLPPPSPQTYTLWPPTSSLSPAPLHPSLCRSSTKPQQSQETGCFPTHLLTKQRSFKPDLGVEGALFSADKQGKKNKQSPHSHTFLPYLFLKALSIQSWQIHYECEA